jgi:hypothetical protein
MAFLLISLFVAFMLCVSSSWAIQHYKRRYERREKLASGVIGLSAFVIFLVMLLGERVFVGRDGERVGLLVFTAFLFTGVVVVYVLLKSDSSGS